MDGYIKKASSQVLKRIVSLEFKVGVKALRSGDSKKAFGTDKIKAKALKISLRSV